MTTFTERANKTFTIGGDLEINRLGYGSLHLTGKGEWGPPADRGEACRVLRRVVEIGINYIDTADSYGPDVTEDLIREALHPYPDDLVIATKAGLLRPRPGEWVFLGHPTYLRQQVEMSLRRLHIERIDLFQLHRIDPNYPLQDQIGELATLRSEGKIRHIGLSEITVEQLQAAQQITQIATVTNEYNLSLRKADQLLDVVTAQGLGFIPWAPLGDGLLTAGDGAMSRLPDEQRTLLQRVAAAHDATVSQIALAWLLQRSPVTIPIPGTTSIAHLEENLAAAEITLSDSEFAALNAIP